MKPENITLATYLIGLLLFIAATFIDPNNDSDKGNMGGGEG